MEARKRFRRILILLGLNVPLILLVLAHNVGLENLSLMRWFYLSNLALGYYLLPLIILAALLFLLSLPVNRVAEVGSFILVIVFIYYLVIDSYVFGIFKFHIDPFWLDFAAKDFSGLGLSGTMVAAIAALLAGVVLLETGIMVAASRLALFRNVIRVFPFLVLFAFAVSQVLHIVMYERNDQRITALTPSLPLYMPFTSHRNAVAYGHLLPVGSVDTDDLERRREDASIRYPVETLVFGESKSGRTPDIVMILLESWRYDSFDPVTTPNIYSFAAGSSVFEDHISSGNQTTCGIFGLFYGMHPTYWPVVKANSASIDNPVLIDVLVKNGYSFGIFAKSNFERHKIKDTMFSGIDVHEDFPGGSIIEEDLAMTDSTLQFIEDRVEARKPYMAMVFYKSSHAPYHYPEEDAIYADTKDIGMTVSGGTDPEPYLNDYRNSLHYSDRMVGMILDRLEALGVLDNTIVVITTDHGESFNDQRENFWGHGSSFTASQLHVPFILHAPGRPPSTTDRRTTHIDLVPTLMGDYFGCLSDPGVYSNGMNLFSDSGGTRPVVVGSYVSHSYVFGEDVYEVVFAYTKKYKLHDLHQEASSPSPALLRTVIEEMSRFMGD